MDIVGLTFYLYVGEWLSHCSAKTGYVGSSPTVESY